MKLLKPIEKIIYKCPYCDYTNKSFKKMKKHIQIPLSKGIILPKGFVFAHNLDKKFDKRNTNIYVIFNSEQISSKEVETIQKAYSYIGQPHIAAEGLTTHDYTYNFEWYHWCEELLKLRYVGTSYDWSNLLQKKFIEGDNFLLNEEQFEEFKRERIKPNKKGSPENKKLIRTINNIEKFLL